ncbi:uncharacterized protein F5891DRAFT_1214175 [Suillus fuscotomentosus]|uniref:F-box domain-containing protein n=1 Tax=Suillus fuscotomentosus TaxID=1912939 RepID=A0AAD4ED96_9AGAM|nr:uncharacterized protein F5891DRAFT_1214175 [Suillus fuscotomentosus]KAG1902869.1 hypothetical protein F5891DRAFT_1214175 [Suillus fuscotomentosus]
MHHALLIPDVRAHIFASIKEDRQLGRCTFAMLARTCSALSEASLDVLWSELDSLRPLSSCIYAANTVSSSDELTIEANDDTRPDFSVFDKYAHRVRKLDLSGQQRFLRRNGGYPSLTEDLGALLYYTLNSPLLPNLRHLAWAPGMGLNLLRHLLGPHLLSLKIPSHRWSSASTLFALTKIPALCPKIKSLTLQVHSWDGHIDSELTQSSHCISRVIGSWPKLEELDCNPMTFEGVLRLSGMESLRILRLQVNAASVIELPPDSLSFPSLHTFQFQTDTLDTAITLMKAMKSFPKSLKIDVFAGRSRRGTCSPEIVGVLLGLVGRDAFELRHFSLNLPFLLGDNPENVSEILRPLFVCRELRTLSLRMSSPFTLGDDDLEMMARAWPLLEELELIDLRPRVATHTPPPLPPPPPPPPPPPQPLNPQLPLPPITTTGLGQPNQAPQPQVVTVTIPHHMPMPLPLAHAGQANQFLYPPAFTISPPVFPVFPPPDLFFPVRSRTAELTFHGLILLLKLCPNLYYFDLALDATKLDDLQGDRPGGGVCNRLVKYARLIDSPIGDPEVVARILFDILPELDPLAGPNALLPVPPPHLPAHNMTPQRWNLVRQRMMDFRHNARHGTPQPVSEI